MALRRSTQTLLFHARTLGPASSGVTASSLQFTRQYHPTRNLCAINDQPMPDREALNPRRSEGTKSGTDDDAAQTDAAFDRHNTEPKTEKESAQGNGNPLGVSGANRDVSATPNPKEETDKSDKKTRSGAGEQKKGGKVGPM
ncbi:hypothetical protein N657DRAFT_638927 [Parathielavia appendiculata]|uniref:Uncharacterized protein n=1 Tax=Parathielavia appendiculata TaxID=2587402 RepID=A0AAN6Z8F1_9PEZI|nr:hypothetical protein N657DRAFT_638927 [Parathielavia appendiculata]